MSLKLELVEWSGGRCIYLNGYRVAGGKPWGGGHMAAEWNVRQEDVLKALGLDKLLVAAKALREAHQSLLVSSGEEVVCKALIDIDKAITAPVGSE